MPNIKNLRTDSGTDDDECWKPTTRKKSLKKSQSRQHRSVTLKARTIRKAPDTELVSYGDEDISKWLLKFGFRQIFPSSDEDSADEISQSTRIAKTQAKLPKNRTVKSKKAQKDSVKENGCGRGRGRPRGKEKSDRLKADEGLSISNVRAKGNLPKVTSNNIRARRNGSQTNITATLSVKPMEKTIENVTEDNINVIQKDSVKENGCGRGRGRPRGKEKSDRLKADEGLSISNVRAKGNLPKVTSNNIRARRNGSQTNITATLSVKPMEKTIENVTEDNINVIQKDSVNEKGCGRGRRRGKEKSDVQAKGKLPKATSNNVRTRRNRSQPNITVAMSVKPMEKEIENVTEENINVEQEDSVKANCSDSRSSKQKRNIAATVSVERNAPTTETEENNDVQQEEFGLLLENEADKPRYLESTNKEVVDPIIEKRAAILTDFHSWLQVKGSGDDEDAVDIDSYY